jgi:hypothetical protein
VENLPRVALGLLVLLVTLAILLLGVWCLREEVRRARARRARLLISLPTPTVGVKISTADLRCRYCGCSFPEHADDLD